MIDMRLMNELSKERILITEAGLSRIIDKLSKNKNDFAIITSYRYEYDKKENINRNRSLRNEFNKRKMGIYQLVGHWRECQIENVPYKDCPKDMLIDVIERSYLVIRPDEMKYKDFCDMILSLINRFQQDSALICKYGNIFSMEKDGNLTLKGFGLTLNKISQAYSQFVKKLNIPFVFEAELPGTNFGRELFRDNGISYPLVNKNEVNILNI